MENITTIAVSCDAVSTKLNRNQIRSQLTFAWGMKIMWQIKFMRFIFWKIYSIQSYHVEKGKQ